MDFSNKNLWPLFEIGGRQVYVTQTLLATWIVMGALILFAAFVRIRLRSFGQIPTGFQNAVESAVEGVDGLVAMTLGEGFDRFGGFFLSLFAFIISSNYTALIGLRPPTSDLSTTAALALTTFSVIHITGIARNGGRYFKEYMKPVALFLPLNIVGELAKPVSLAFRLFGNILGGVIIFGLVYELFPTALKFVVPNFLHAYLDFFVGALQAFIFTVLSMAFVQQKAVIEEN